MAGNGVDVASSLTQSEWVAILLIVVIVLFTFGIIWAIATLINLSDEKKKYYKNLNKNLEKNE